MCGLIGFTFKNERLLSSGLDAIAHRGPDAQAVFSSEEISLGHCRLSIIDLDASANQPMKRGDVSIVFNGEVYNFQELRDDLRRLGHSFSTLGDTEVIIEGYKQYGIEIFRKLRGMWAIALYHATQQKLILARDMFGIKPLYYAIKDGQLFFSSEVKGLLRVLPTVQPNAAMYSQFFNLGYVCAPDTCYQQIKKLNPGEIFEWDMEKRAIVSRASSMPRLVPAPEGTSFEDAVEIVDQALRESVQAHYLSDVPVGLLLSGGNDSSLLAAVSVALGKTPRLFHLAVQGSTDTYYAELVAKHLRMPLETVFMNEDALAKQYDRVWDLVDEPTGDTSIIPTSLIYSKIKGESKVVLSGEGGDELFGGYARHAQLMRATKVQSYPILAKLLDELGRGTSLVAMSRLNPIVSRVRNLLLQYGPIHDVLTAYLKGVRIIDYPYESKAVREKLFTTIMSSEERAWVPTSLFFDLWTYLPNNLMYKNDVASMASSIEARVPFLDKVFVETIITRVSAKYLLSPNYTSKTLLKKVMERYLPSELIYRDKRGFGFSPTKYFAHQMKSDVRAALRFHADHTEAFGIKNSTKGLFDVNKSELLLKKYPRFAFAVISNWKIWKSRLS